MRKLEIFLSLEISRSMLGTFWIFLLLIELKCRVFRFLHNRMIQRRRYATAMHSNATSEKKLSNERLRLFCFAILPPDCLTASWNQRLGRTIRLRIWECLQRKLLNQETKLELDHKNGSNGVFCFSRWRRLSKVSFHLAFLAPVIFLAKFLSHKVHRKPNEKFFSQKLFFSLSPWPPLSYFLTSLKKKKLPEDFEDRLVCARARAHRSLRKTCALAEYGETSSMKLYRLKN